MGPAQTLFLRHGYEQTSTDAVAGLAGVSKATVYGHFRSKQALFAAVIERRRERLQSVEAGPARRAHRLARGRPRAVRRRDVRPRVIAYGLARPARRWRAIARVDGEVIETHPQLDAGHLLRQGTLLLRIEATDYELQVERLSAETDNLKAQLRELERTETNECELLKVEQESLRLAEAEVERLGGLRGRGAASQSELDRARRERLTAKRQVRTLQNSLRLIPVRRQQLRASLRAALLQIKKTDTQDTLAVAAAVKQAIWRERSRHPALVLGRREPAGLVSRRVLFLAGTWRHHQHAVDGGTAARHRHFDGRRHRDRREHSGARRMR